MALLVAVIARRSGDQHGPDNAAAGITAAVSSPPAMLSDRCLMPMALTPAQLRDEAQRTAATTPTALAAGQPAREPLRALANTINPSECDSRTGPFDAVAMLQWHFDTASSTGRTRASTVLTQARHWRGRDGSGRSITFSHPQAGNPGADDIYRPDEVPDAQGSLPTDPGLLAARWNNTQPLSTGPQYTLRALADMNLWHSPNRAVRAAAITVLKDTDGIDYHGKVTDRAQRTGIAVSATSDNGGARDLIILDPHTGELLAYEKAAMRDPGKLGITGPTVLSYRLDLTHTRTAAANPS